VIRELSKDCLYSLIGINVANKKITSKKIYFLLTNEKFSFYCKKYFKIKIPKNIIIKDDVSIGTRYPIIGFKVYNNRINPAIYYNLKCKIKNFEPYMLVGKELENERIKRKYFYVKNKKLVKNILLSYKIPLVSVDGIEICKGKGIRDNKIKNYEKIALISTPESFIRLKHPNIFNLSIIAYGKDNDLITESFYYTDLNEYKVPLKTILKFQLVGEYLNK